MRRRWLACLAHPFPLPLRVLPFPPPPLYPVPRPPPPPPPFPPDITYEPALAAAVVRAYEALLVRPDQDGLLAATRRGDAPWAALQAALAATPLAVADVSAAVRAAAADAWAYVGVDASAVSVYRLWRRGGEGGDGGDGGGG